MTDLARVFQVLLTSTLAAPIETYLQAYEGVHLKSVWDVCHNAQTDTGVPMSFFKNLTATIFQQNRKEADRLMAESVDIIEEFTTGVVTEWLRASEHSEWGVLDRLGREFSELLLLFLRIPCLCALDNDEALDKKSFTFATVLVKGLCILLQTAKQSSHSFGSRICDSSQLNDLVSWLAALTKSLAHTTNVTSHLLIDTHTQVPLWNLSLVLANHPDCMIRTHSQSAILSLLSILPREVSRDLLMESSCELSFLSVTERCLVDHCFELNRLIIARRAKLDKCTCWNSSLVLTKFSARYSCPLCVKFTHVISQKLGDIEDTCAFIDDVLQRARTLTNDHFLRMSVQAVVLEGPIIQICLRTILYHLVNPPCEESEQELGEHPWLKHLILDPLTARLVLSTLLQCFGGPSFVLATITRLLETVPYLPYFLVSLLTGPPFAALGRSIESSCCCCEQGSQWPPSSWIVNDPAGRDAMAIDDPLSSKPQRVVSHKIDLRKDATLERDTTSEGDTYGGDGIFATDGEHLDRRDGVSIKRDGVSVRRDGVPARTDNGCLRDDSPARSESVAMVLKIVLARVTAVVPTLGSHSLTHLIINPLRQYKLSAWIKSMSIPLLKNGGTESVQERFYRINGMFHPWDILQALHNQYLSDAAKDMIKASATQDGSAAKLMDFTVSPGKSFERARLEDYQSVDQAFFVRTGLHTHNVETIKRKDTVATVMYDREDVVEDEWKWTLWSSLLNPQHLSVIQIRHVVDVLREVCGTKVDDNTLGKLKQLVKFQFEHILAMTVLERDLSSPDLTGRNRWSRRSSTLTENQNVCVSLLRSTVCEDFFVENCLMQLMQQDSIERSPAVNRSLWALAGVADLMLLIRHAHTLARSDPDIDHSIPDTSSTFLLALDGSYEQRLDPETKPVDLLVKIFFLCERLTQKFPEVFGDRPFLERVSDILGANPADVACGQRVRIQPDSLRRPEDDNLLYRCDITRLASPTQGAETGRQGTETRAETQEGESAGDTGCQEMIREQLTLSRGRFNDCVGEGELVACSVTIMKAPMQRLSGYLTSSPAALLLIDADPLNGTHSIVTWLWGYDGLKVGIGGPLALHINGETEAMIILENPPMMLSALYLILSHLTQHATRSLHDIHSLFRT